MKPRNPRIFRILTHEYILNTRMLAMAAGFLLAVLVGLYQGICWLRNDEWPAIPLELSEAAMTSCPIYFFHRSALFKANFSD
jgi:hypothetical protein